MGFSHNVLFAAEWVANRAQWHASDRLRVTLARGWPNLHSYPGHLRLDARKRRRYNFGSQSGLK